MGRSIWCWTDSLQEVWALSWIGEEVPALETRPVQKVGGYPPGLHFDKSVAVGERSPNSCCMVDSALPFWGIVL